MAKILSKIDWKNKSEIVDFVHENYRQRAHDLRDYHQEMYVNILWALVGAQDIHYDRYSKKLQDVKPDPWKVRLISNLLYPMLRRSVAKLAKKPIWDVMPATTEQDDIEVAQLSTQILKYYWLYLRMPKKYLQWLTWLMATGNAIWKAGWDEEAGDRIDLSNEDRLALKNVAASSGQPNKRIPKFFYLGDPFIDITSPFSLFWEGGTGVEEAEWSVELRLRTPSYVYERWGVEVSDEGIRADTQKAGIESYEFKLMNILESKHGQISRKTSALDKVVTYELFTRQQSSNGKQGHHAVVVGNDVVYRGRNIYGDLPYVHVVEQFVPGTEHGMCTVRQNRPNQAEYNKVRSGIIEHANLMCNQKWLIPRGAQVLVKSFTNKPGEKIEYNYPFKPEATKPPPLPAYYERILQVCKEDMADIGSIQAVTQAKAEPGIRSGRAVLALQEADDLMLGPVMQLIDDGLVQLGRKLLKIIAENIHEERLLRITGDDHQLEVMTFTGKNIYGANKGQPGINYFDVRIQTYTTYPMSRMGMEDRIDRLLERGVLHPEAHRQKILHMLGSGDLTSIFDETQADRAIASRENYQMLQGEQVMANPIEHHITHLEVHDRFWKSRIKKIDSNLGKMVMAHREEHEKLQAFEMVRKQAFTQQAMMGLGMIPPVGAGAGAGVK